MKEFKRHNITQKIIITICIVILLFNLILPTYSKADDSFGGQLWEPVQNLLLGLGDEILNILQRTFIEGAPDAVFKCTQAEFLYGESFGTKYENFVTGLPFVIGDFFSWFAALGDNITDDDSADTNEDGKVSTEEAQVFWGKDIVFPSIFYSVENIFANKIPAFDVNFINPTVTPPNVIDNAKDIREQVTGETAEEASSTKAIGNIASQLQVTIAKWYNALRILSLVAMLSVLVYLGIRITLGSVAQEQAKYKIMLKDWLIAICLLFVMHYIMVLGLTITENLTEMLYSTYADALNSQTLSNEKTDITAETMATSIRLAVSVSSLEWGESMGYTIMYAVFIIYTIMFTWQYLKRVIYMAFLTMIAPLVAITYPIDKMKDGQAQAFNMWMKEYIFNLLLQPLHMLIFTMLVLSATDLMKNNIIYSIVALGFLSQSIKILKKLFGFDKPPIGGGGLAAGFAGGAVFNTALNALQHIPGLGAHHSGTSAGGAGSNTNKINYAAGSERGAELKGLSAFSGQGGTDGNESKQAANISLINNKNLRRQQRREALKKYLGEGYRKNAEGYYYNPNTKKYDPTYNPVKDKKFNMSLGENGKLGKAYRGPKINTEKTKLANQQKGTKNININGEKIDNSNNVHYDNKDKGKEVSRRNSNRSVIRGVTSVAGRYVPKVGLGVAKVATAGLLAGTLGTIGVAAGLTSDNSSDAFKLGATGLTAGAMMGNAVPETVINTGKGVIGGAKEFKEVAEKGYHGEKYEEVKADKAYAKSKEVKNHFKLKFGDKWENAKNMAIELRKLGITEQKDIDTAIKLMFKHDELSIEEVASLMKFKDVVSRAELRDQKKRDRIKQKILEMGIDEKQAKIILELLDEILDV